jgi:hypothetical protein
VSNTKKIKAGLVLQDPSEFVGHAGTLFYNPETGTMYLSDGVTPGGISLGQGGSGGGFSGNYADLTNKPNLQVYATNTYVDNKTTWGNITSKPSFAAVATSGSYNDLTNKPSIPSLSGYATESYVSSAVSGKVDSTSLALVATSGSYHDLEYLPTISTVGQTGNYEDLRNKPSIPSVVGLATENYVTSQGFITTAALSSYATQTWVEDQNYITSASLSSYATTSWISDQNYVDNSALNSALSLYALSTDIPTNTSDLSNDSGFITSSDLPDLSGYALSSSVPTKTSDLSNDSGFITSADLPTVNAADRLVSGDYEIVLGTDGVLTTGNIDVGNLALITVPGGDAITSYNSKDVDIFTNVGDGAYSEVWIHHEGNVEITTNGGQLSWNFDTTGNLVLPPADMLASPAPVLSGIVFSDGTFQNTAAATDINQLTDNDGLLGQGGSGFSGDYNDLINTPTIPTTTSQLSNDSGFITSADIPFVPTSLGDLGITAGSDGQVLTLNSSLVPIWTTPSTGGGNPFDQSLNTSDSPTFSGLTVDNGGISFPNGDNIYTGNGGDIDLYTDWDSGQGVEVWLQHNNRVSITTGSGTNEWAFDQYGSLTAPGDINANGRVYGNGLTIVNSNNLSFDQNGSEITEQRPGQDYSFPATPVTTVTGNGANAKVNVSFAPGDTSYQVSTNDGGDFTYVVGDQLKVTGDLLGGVTPDNDLIVEVASTYFDQSPGAVFSVNVVSGTPVTYLDGLHVRTNGYEWTFGTDGNLVLSNGIKFADGSVQTTAATGSGGGNPFNQDLNTGDTPSFSGITINGNVDYSNGVVQRTGGYVTCNPNMDTVVYTGLDSFQTLKLLFNIEGIEDGQTQTDTQSCEMIVAKSLRNNTVSGSAYGLVYTSNGPLVTLSTRWNLAINKVEILCRPTSTVNSVSVLSTCTEIYSATLY